MYYIFFFFNDTATTEIYTLSLHDALPISDEQFHRSIFSALAAGRLERAILFRRNLAADRGRSEEHTSELQSQSNLVCRLLLEKKKNYSFYYLLHVINVRSLLLDNIISI